jgi:gliding motility-associatede transport system auxiliary component
MVRQGAGKFGKKGSDLLFFASVVIMIFLVNFIGGQFFFRLDLTEEKRYSLSNSTKEILRNLKDDIYIEIFLDGDLPSDFKRLRQSIKETLEEFRVYSDQKLNYEFRNPRESEDPAQNNEVLKHLIQRGIRPTTLFVNEGDQRTEKVIFPGAIINYLDREAPIGFLTGDPSTSSRVQLNQSIENLEFELISRIKLLTNRNKKKVAFLQGHGELNPLESGDFIATAGQLYEIRRVRLQSAAVGDFEGLVNLLDYEAIIIAKPDSGYSEQDKFKLDQYVIKGGKLIFFIDGMDAEIDSVGEAGMISRGLNLNLDDLFFQWGFRLNRNLVQDQFSAAIPLVVGYMGERPQYQMIKWPYFPILNEFAEHPISRNSQPIYSKFISTLDTIKAGGIKKTPLIWTSTQTRAIPSPIKIDFNEVRKPPPKELFNKGKLIVSLLLEGIFSSAFEGRISNNTAMTFGFQNTGLPSQIVIFSDGDLIKNDINSKTKLPYPLGYDKFSKVTFGNKPLILNVLDFLLDDNGIIEARNKKVILRPLDPVKVKAQANLIKALNIGGPLALLLTAGFFIQFFRKRKYNKKVS